MPALVQVGQVQHGAAGVLAVGRLTRVDGPVLPAQDVAQLRVDPHLRPRHTGGPVTQQIQADMGRAAQGMGLSRPGKARRVAPGLELTLPGFRDHPREGHACCGRECRAEAQGRRGPDHGRQVEYVGPVRRRGIGQPCRHQGRPGQGIGCRPGDRTGELAHGNLHPVGQVHCAHHLESILQGTRPRIGRGHAGSAPHEAVDVGQSGGREPRLHAHRDQVRPEGWNASPGHDPGVRRYEAGQVDAPGRQGLGVLIDAAAPAESASSGAGEYRRATRGAALTLAAFGSPSLASSRTPRRADMRSSRLQSRSPHSDATTRCAFHHAGPASPASRPDSARVIQALGRGTGRVWGP
jgi:hypothetical protein